LLLRLLVVMRLPRWGWLVVVLGDLLRRGVRCCEPCVCWSWVRPWCCERGRMRVMVDWRAWVGWCVIRIGFGECVLWLREGLALA